jgi:hypothetical protein
MLELNGTVTRQDQDQDQGGNYFFARCSENLFAFSVCENHRFKRKFYQLVE